MAVPPAPSAYSTVTSFVLAGASVTVKVRFTVPASPSLTRGESMESAETVSSSAIVPVPDAVPTAAPSALPSVTTTVSSDSAALSPITDTVMVLLLSPAAKVRVPGASAV